MKRAAPFLLIFAPLVALAWVAIPIFLIQPFAAQTPRGIALSYALRSRSELVTVLLLAAALVAAFSLWPRIRWIGRTFTCLALVVVGGLAFLARQNHFEWMFGPLPDPRFITVASATHVAPEDLVLGVRVGEEAHAFPVRAIAYHHVVNDVVAGTPIVATY